MCKPHYTFCLYCTQSLVSITNYTKLGIFSIKVLQLICFSLRNFKNNSDLDFQVLGIVEKKYVEAKKKDKHNIEFYSYIL